MLIDKAIEMFEDVEGTEHNQVLVFLKEAQAYDVGGVHALLSYMKKREKLKSFLDTVEQHPGTSESLAKMGQFIWMEGIANSPFGCLIVFNPVEHRTDAHLVDPQGRGYAKLTCLDEDDTWHRLPDGEPVGNSILRIIQILLTTAYLASNPRNQIVTVQQERDEKRNKRSTKVLRPRRKQVRTIIIDGVERIPNPATGTPTFKVHARCWHCRRHKVIEHFRVYQSGKVVKIHAHERGDIARGYVPWFSGNYFDAPEKPNPRYKVLPDKSFFTIGAGSGEVDR
jgi:hypothetical protein